MTIPYTDEYLRRMYSELGYDELLTLYEFIDRVANGQLAIDDERTEHND